MATAGARQQGTASSTGGGRSRVRLLKLTWPIPVVLLLVALKLLTMVAVNDSGRGQYSDGDPVTAAQVFARLEAVNVVQPWIAPYNRGTALLLSGDLAGADQQLTTALATVPAHRSCIVATNLARAKEAQGDQVASSDPAAAQAKYAEALTLLQTHQCPVRDTESSRAEQQVQKTAVERLNQKAQQSSSSPTQSQSSSSTPSSNSSPNNSSREEEQKKRNTEAEKQKQKQEDDRGTSGPIVEKPW